MGKLSHGNMERIRSILCCLIAFGLCSVRFVSGAILTGTFTPIPEGDVINLSAVGRLDWVHWGLFTDSSLDRKAGVTPQLPDFKPIGFNGPFQYADNYNGYNWVDGTPTSSVTNTITGVWMYGKNDGFQLDIPVGTSTSVLRVYVGTFGAVGKFDAALSGTSLKYSDASITNVSNGTGGYYTLTNQADSPGQILTIKYVVERIFDSAGNVTLQAAALDAPGANNPPSVSIVSPVDGANFSANDNVTIAVEAADTDGTVAQVEFYQGDTKVGESTGSPYSVTWAHVPPEKYTLTARARDDRGAIRVSAPVEIFVNSGGGALAGGPPVLPPGAVDLSAEGTLDWAHWGLSSPASFDHKAGAPPQISDITKIGSGNLQQLMDNFTAFTWSDGTPTAGAGATRSGVFVHGWGDGFRITAPADTRARTLKIYAGLYGAQGKLRAYLSDFSAPAYSDTSPRSIYGNIYAVYALDYSAASAGKMLVVEFTARNLFDADYGNVTLQAATLAGGAPPTNSPPFVTITSPTSNDSFPAGSDITIQASASDGDGAVTLVRFFSGTNLLGTAASSPYTFTWMSVPAGTYSLTAAATDDQGVTATSSAVSITVASRVNVPPAIAIIFPTNNTVFVAPATITIQATASDSDGTVTQVELFEGGTSLGIDTTSPYLLVWSNVTAGSYSLTAEATDNDGAITSSDAINIVVNSSTVAPVTLANPNLQPDQFSFSFASELNRTYGVERTLTLAPINWQILTNAVGDGTVITVTVPTLSQSQQFFRITAQ